MNLASAESLPESNVTSDECRRGHNVILAAQNRRLTLRRALAVRRRQPREGRGFSSLSVGAVGSQWVQGSVLTAGEENERPLLAFRRSRHLVEVASWCGSVMVW